MGTCRQDWKPDYVIPGTWRWGINPDMVGVNLIQSTLDVRTAMPVMVTAQKIDFASPAGSRDNQFKKEDYWSTKLPFNVV